MPSRSEVLDGRKKGRTKGVGFVHHVAELVIPDLAIIHAQIVQLVVENTFDSWREATRVGSRRGEHMATAHFNADGSIRWEVTKAGKELGVTTSSGPRRINIVCLQCGSSEWQRKRSRPQTTK